MEKERVAKKNYDSLTVQYSSRSPNSTDKTNPRQDISRYEHKIHDKLSTGQFRDTNKT